MRFLTHTRYDKAGQLLSAGSASYSYDANGNRTLAGYQTGKGNELLSDGIWNYTYDTEGNVLTKTNIATGAVWTYGYDLDNQLTSAVEKDSSGATLQSVTLKYDVFGQLVEKDTTTGGQTTVQRYAFDAEGNVWADLDGNNNLVARRLYADINGQTRVLARETYGGGSATAAAWYLTDHLGSVRDIQDNVTGAELDHLDYDAYGNLTTETQPGNGDRFKYAQGTWDATLGLYHFGARWYDPASGRWEEQDPLGLGPDSNDYRYVGNGPTNDFDPSGEDGAVASQSGAVQWYQHGQPTSLSPQQRHDVAARAANREFARFLTGKLPDPTGPTYDLGKAIDPRLDYSAGDLIAMGRHMPDDVRLVNAGWVTRAQLALINRGRALRHIRSFGASGYYDAFGRHLTFCLSCHSRSDPGAQLKMYMAVRSPGAFYSRVAVQFLPLVIPFGGLAAEAGEGAELAELGELGELSELGAEGSALETSLAPNAVRGSVEVIDVPAAGRLRPANPVNGEITLYHGSTEAGVNSLRAEGMKPVGFDDGLLNVTTDPAVAVRYANHPELGPVPRGVAVIRIPEATFQDLFSRGLIKPHEVLPNCFQITPEGQAVINQLLGH